MDNKSFKIWGKHVEQITLLRVIPHHDMLGGGCQVRVVIENTMGKMENLRTLISGFLGLVILVRWALVHDVPFLNYSDRLPHPSDLCQPDRVRLRVDIQLISWNVFRYSQLRRLTGSNLLTFFLTYLLTFFLTYLLITSSDISSDILSDISSDILSDIFLTYLLTFFLTNLLTLFLTYLLTFYLSSDISKPKT